MNELYLTNVDQTGMNTVVCAVCIHISILCLLPDNEEREKYIQRFVQNSFGTAGLGELSSYLISASRIKLIEKIGQGNQ